MATKSRKRAFSSLEESSKELWWVNRSNPWFHCLSFENEFQIEEIAFRSTELLIFDSDKCDHEFKLSPFAITFHGMWCPFCSGRPVLCRVR